MNFPKRIFLALGLGILALAGAGGALAAFGGATSHDSDQPITGTVLEQCTAAALAANPGGVVTETEVGDDGAAYGVEIRLADGREVEVNLNESCEVIGQEPDHDGPNEGPDDDQPITGSALEQCTAAALAANPGGVVTETEVGDDGAAYDVEIRLADGREIEVNLNESCEVIGQEADQDGPNEGPDDDGPNHGNP